MFRSYADLPNFKEEFTEAFRKQAIARDESFFDAPSEGKIPLCHLTLKTLLILQLAENPIVSGGDVARDDILAYLWLHSPKFKEGEFRDKFDISLLHFKDDYLLSVALDHYEYQMIELCDNEYAQRVEDESTPDRRLSNITAYYVHLLASAYNWEEEKIINLPINRLIQYKNLILGADDPGYKANLLTDRVVSKFNIEYNKYLAETKLKNEQ